LSQRQWSTALFNMATVPMKQGDFSGLRAINDPVAGGSPFAGNRIPSSRISPAATFLMKYMRDPNLPASGPPRPRPNFIRQNPTVQDSPRIGVKVDYNPTSNDMLSGGLKIFNDGPYLRSGGGPELYGNYTQGFVQRQYFGAYTKLLSPRVTNELRGAVTTPYGYHLTNTLSDVVDPGQIFPALNAQCCAELRSPDKNTA